MEAPTSARVVLDQELVEGHPASAHSHHHGRLEDAYQAQFLGVAKLEMRVKVVSFRLGSWLAFFLELRSLLTR